MERKIGLFSARALANASSPQGSQSTGLSACWRRYGDFSAASLLPIAYPIALPRKAKEGRSINRPLWTAHAESWARIAQGQSSFSLREKVRMRVVSVRWTVRGLSCLERWIPLTLTSILSLRERKLSLIE